MLCNRASFVFMCMSVLQVRALGFIDIEALSSKNETHVFVDDKMVLHVESEASWLTSGLHLVVLHEATGAVLLNRKIATTSFGEASQIPSLVASLKNGRIVVVVVKEDANLNMSLMGQQFLSLLGIDSIALRASYVWAGIVRGKSCLSSGIHKSAPHTDDYTNPVHTHIRIPKSPPETSCFPTPNKREALRFSFCRRHEGYGPLCDCLDPAPLSYKPKELEFSTLLRTPLVVVAGNRPTLLYRSLATLLGQPGGDRRRIIVAVDGIHPEVFELLDLLQIRHVHHISTGANISSRISDHTRFSIAAALQEFPDAEKLIILEEDLLAAPDFFSYFNQTGGLLDVDPTLVCVSAWNDMGVMHGAHDPRRLYRVHTLPGLGWMVTRTTAKDLLLIWPSREKEHDWDSWMRGPWGIGQRECVIPEVSRTFHMSVSGAHSTGVLHMAFFQGHPLTSQPNILLDKVDRMTMQNYEEDLHNELQGSDVAFLNTSLHPCHPKYLPRTKQDFKLIIFIRMRYSTDLFAWKKLSSCIGMWNLDVRSSHNGLFIVSFYGIRIFVIGVPYSDYSYIKPPWIKAVEEPTDLELNYLKNVPLSNRRRFRVPGLERHLPYMDFDKPYVI